jgi:hypothetical protein
MAIVRRSSHRWWIFLVTIAGAMAATAVASAREMGGKATCDFARGIMRHVSETRSPEGQMTGTSRVGAQRFSPGAQSDERPTLRVGRHARLRIDAEVWGDRIEEDDDSDLPVRAWFRDMVRCSHEVIVPKCNSRFPFINAHSSFSRLSQQLRC